MAFTLASRIKRITSGVGMAIYGPGSSLWDSAIEDALSTFDVALKAIATARSTIEAMRAVPRTLKGTHSVAGGTLPAAVNGDVWVISGSGSVAGVQYVCGERIVCVQGAWRKVPGVQLGDLEFLKGERVNYGLVNPVDAISPSTPGVTSQSVIDGAMSNISSVWVSDRPSDGSPLTTARTVVFSKNGGPTLGTYNATYDSIGGSGVTTFDTSADTGSTVQDVFLSPDGRNMYLSTPASRNLIYHFTLSSPFSPASRQILESANPASAQGGTDPGRIFIRSDGLMLYQCSPTNNKVMQFALVSPWQLANAQFVGEFSVTSASKGIRLRSDGRRLYHHRNDSNVLEYVLTVPWKISSAVAIPSSTLDLATVWGAVTMWGLHLRELGDRIVVVSSTNLAVFSVPAGKHIPGSVSSGVWTRKIINTVDVAKLKVTGTTPSSEGGSVSVAHGIPGFSFSKVVSVKGLVSATAGLIPDGTTKPEHQFGMEADGTNVTLRLHATESGSLLSKPFVALMEYIP